MSRKSILYSLIGFGLFIILCMLLLLVVSNAPRNITTVEPTPDITTLYRQKVIRWNMEFDQVNEEVLRILAGESSYDEGKVAGEKLGRIVNEVENTTDIPEQYTTFHAHYTKFLYNYTMAVLLMSEGKYTSANTYLTSALEERQIANSMFP